MRTERIGDAMLILADCRDWRASLPSCFRADALITDPPYGVEFSGKTTKHTRAKGTVDAYEDTAKIIDDVVLPAISSALSRAQRGAIFCGTTQMFRYPQPDDIGGIVCPNGAGMSKWGFRCYHPVLFYGSRPTVGAYPLATSMYHPGMHVTKENNGHPCPKPIAFMEWLVDLASKPGETVIDPFAGSGTTGVACATLGRKFIGVEIEPKYFDIACSRIDAAYAQQRLFA